MSEKDKLKQNTGEWYLYHNIKNENALLGVIISSIITFFFYNGWFISLCIWIGYGIYCNNNNEKLNNDPEILKEREFWIKVHEKKGDIEQYKRILGIK